MSPRKTILLSTALLLPLAACSDDGYSETEAVTTVDAAEAPGTATSSPIAVDANAPDDSTPATPVAVPQIAYSYAYGFRLPAAAITPLQQQHADMCEARGPSVCRIVSMQQAENDGDYAYGSLSLAVAAGEARAFGKQLAEASGRADGELVSSSIDGEDLSKKIVDTEAQLRARTLLRDRLMEVLRSRKGTVAELVEAERGVAAVNEEIDQAKSWLAEMRWRVAFSTMAVSYASGSPSAGGFAEPIRGALGSVGSILGTIVAFLIMAATVLVPLGLLVWLLVWGARRIDFRRGAASRNLPSTTEPEATD